MEGTCVDPENQMMRIQEVGAGEMSAQQLRITKEDADVYSLMLDEAMQEGEPLIVQLDLK